MYVNIKKVLKLAEITMPTNKEKLQKIQKNYYFPFVYRDYSFHFEYNCTWEATTEAFTRAADIESEAQLAIKIAQTVEEFFESIRSMKR